MWYLIREIIWFLVLTALLWGAVGWWLRGAGVRATLRDMEDDFSSKLQSLRRSRDSYRDQLEQVQVGGEHAGAQLSAQQRAQITAHIRKLEKEASDGRTQVESLSAKLEALTKNAQARENEYKVLRERLDAASRALSERDARISELSGAAANDATDGAGAPGPGAEGSAADTAQRIYRYEETIAKLTARVDALRKENARPMAATEHSKLLNVIQAQKNTIASLNARIARNEEDSEAAPPERAAQDDPALTQQLQQHEAAIAAREKELARAVRERAALAETVDKQEAALAGLREQLRAVEDRPSAAEQRLQDALAQQRQDAQTRDAQHERIAKERAALAETLTRREATIAELRDQLRTACDGQSPADAQLQAALADQQEKAQAREIEHRRIAQERAALAEAVSRHQSTIADLEARLHGATTRPPSADTQLRKALAQQQQQTHALEKELARVREEHEAVLAAARRQKDIIEGLNRQIREQARPAPRPDAAPVRVQSGDLFEDRPQVLLSAPDGEPDDLKKIHGVGPVLEAKLNDLGIFHFRQIAAFDEDDILWIAAQMNSFPKRIMRDRWVSQAARLEAQRRRAAT